MIVTVTPNPSLDLTYQVVDTDSGEPADPAVQRHQAVAAYLEAGGKGVNVTRGLARAGRPGIAVLPIGGSTGQQLAELLLLDRVPYRTVAQACATRVNTTVLGPGGRTTQVNAPGSPLTADERDNLVIAVDHEIATGGADRWLLICGSMPPGTEATELVGRLIDRARVRGVRVAVDSSTAGLLAGLEFGADLLAPNAAELTALLTVAPAQAGFRSTGRYTAGSDPGAAACALAAERGCELLVSLGPEGALWTDGRQVVRARGPAIVPVNTAGAGDALVAGWFSTDPGDDPRLRLATAIRWGAAACLCPTTVPPRTDPNRW